MSAPALLWDLDGTLVDSEPLHLRSARTALEELGLDLPQAFHDTALGLPSERVYQILVDMAGLAVPLAEWEALRLGHFGLMISEMKTREPAGDLARSAATRKVAQAVVSNSGRREVDLSLQATGLAPAFAVTVTRDDVHHGKPHPEGYLAAAEALGVDPVRCLAIEDSTTGTEAGLAAGMSVVFHPQAPHSARPEGAIYLPPEGDLAALVHAHLRA